MPVRRVRRIVLALVTPDTRQLFNRSAQNIGVPVPLLVVRVADEEHAMRLRASWMLFPEARQFARQRNSANQFLLQEAVDHPVIHIDQAFGGRMAE